MPCYHPIDVAIKRKSLYPSKKWDTSDIQTVPCGNCVGCRAEQGRQWAVRMMHESRMHEASAFVTLTLEDKELNENRELCARDFSGFIKRLRKTQKRKISYFGCGEYGEITQRPHYHAAIFGVDFQDRDVGFDTSRPGVWRSRTLDDTWGRGRCEGGTLTMASASYVAGYVRKKVKAKDYERANPLTAELLAAEFARMSLNPAIGRRWIEHWWRDVYPRDFVVIDGVEAKPPRYYDKWMDGQHNGSKACFYGTRCKEHQQVMDDVRNKRYEEAQELDKRELAAREAHAKSRINLFATRKKI